MNDALWKEAFYVLLGLLTAGTGCVLLLLIKHVMALTKVVGTLQTSVAVLTQVTEKLAQDHIAPIRQRLHAIEGWKSQVEATLIRCGALREACNRD